MSGDYTQHQTIGEQLEAERLSLQATTPPAEIPGYRIERFIGAGAFGAVWGARDLNTGRRVAIKFYLHRGGVNWSLLSREVKNLLALSTDRYVVQVLEVGWEAEPPYYVMEYIEAGSLEGLLKTRSRLPVPQATTVFREIAIGLNHCHGKGILHCDLKPANILLDRDLNPRLADFGQSRMSRDQTPALGTLFYMAPEQADLEATPDARWDVYALGAIFYRMLTGNAPHREGDLMRKIDTAGSLPKRLENYRKTIQDSGAPKDHRQLSGMDAKLADIVECCLKPDPETRFQNVQQVLEALQRREASRSRRPLMLLGLVGPLLLLLLTCLFATRSVYELRKRTTEALQQKALDSCQYAAKFVASTLEGDLRNYFQTIETESQAPALRDVMRSLLENPPDGLRDLPFGNSGAELRPRLQEHPPAKALEVYLQELLAQYRPEQAWNEYQPILSTVFVTDARGTIVAIAYSEDPGPGKGSVGGNYFYRSYFTGHREDLPHDYSEKVRPLQHTHLSAPFQSTATGLYKVAISTPIYLDGQADGEPDGVFVGTLNLGDIRLLERGPQKSTSQIAVLVDARWGESRGTILQHPLMDERSAMGQNMAEDLPPIIADQQLATLLQDGLLSYEDPLGDTTYGAAFDGPWIATAQRVSLPSGASTEMVGPQEPSDLAVLVQFRMEQVLQPVRELVDHLLVEGAVTVGAIVLVSVAMWYFAARAVDDPGALDPLDERNLPEPPVTEPVQ